MQNFTEAELATIAAHGLTPKEVSDARTIFPQSFESAIGYVVGMKDGAGQARNKPFQTQEQANADVSGTYHVAGELGDAPLTTGSDSQT